MFLSSGTGKELFQQVVKARKRERRGHNHVETMRCHLTPVRMVTISLKKNKQGGGRGVQDREHMYSMADSCKCMAKTTTIL